MISNSSMLPAESVSPSPLIAKTPRVLTVLTDFPLPATSGYHLRMVSNLDLVRRLGCFSALLYFSTEQRDPPPFESTAIVRLCDEVQHGGRRFPHKDFSTASLIRYKTDFLVRGAFGIPGRRYPFSLSYDHIGAEERVLAEARRVGADFVVLPSSMLHYAARLKRNGFRIIADASDVLSDLTARFLHSYGKHGIRRWGLVANHAASRTQERVFLPLCSEVWATSAPEAETLARIAPEVNVVVVANSLDENLFQPSLSADSESIGFIGTYSYSPNLEAALFLANQVFPFVLRDFPNARLKLAGANLPSSEAEQLRELPYVDVLGAIAESEELYRQCRVIALPVFVRGGVPLKLIEAFAREKPVVACPELIAGLPVYDGHDVLVRKTPQDFAQGISQLLSDSSLRKRLGCNGRETFMQNWSRSYAEEVLRSSSVLISGRTSLAPD